MDSAGTTSTSESREDFEPCSRAVVDTPEDGWIHDPAAWDYFCSLLTSLYAMFIIVFAVVMELSQKFTSDEWFMEMLFYSYMYGTGITFLLYCYLFQMHPAWLNGLIKWLERKKWICPGNTEVPQTTHSSDGAGSLYLRLGTLCFGSSGIVLFCLEFFVCISDHLCFAYRLVNWVFAAAFTFIQMHFIFCNSKIIITESKNLAKLGTMHLLAVNVWTWLRFVIAKHDGKSVYVEHILNRSDSLLLPRIDENYSVPPDEILSIRIYSFYYFGDFATLLTTCIVEYSVIGAAIMFVLWRSIDDHCIPPSYRPKRKNKVRIDCSASSAGLFAGVLFLICALVSIGIYTIFSQHSDDRGALLVFRLSDFALFCFTLIGCIVGLYRMRFLHYQSLQIMTNAEFLDEILLIIGLLGELIHSSTGLMCWITTQSEWGQNKMETYMLVVFVVREIQVIVQAVFILVSSRLRAQSPKAMSQKPGKQFVTFLLIANVSLFFFHTLEGMKSVFGDAIASRRTKPYATLICAVAPLVVFYRFHSSVCLAEIWKHCYNTKNSPRSLKSPASETSVATRTSSINERDLF
ncbi:unnamed protein product [Bursaphelenchus xylophilus]|uniref:(pine wood nematode) hypothetical protein n=1 Tax=Bursaphelenchus xylophilus TaxID=6326 RepID=A0A7I8X0V8_BURXY|nr:unnamed protein product [Bursaphelenchus xylophilus]CAG9129972.1 unnamed protein product [Bursaphelenchus xylophilus]